MSYIAYYYANSIKLSSKILNWLEIVHHSDTDMPKNYYHILIAIPFVAVVHFWKTF